MKLENIINALTDLKNKGCKGTVGITLNDNKEKSYMVDNIEYMYDALENGTEGIIIKAIELNDYIKKESIRNITYGTVLKIHINDESDEVDTVMLIDNSSAGCGFDCMVLDLSTKEILMDYIDIADCKNNCDIVEVVGDFNELFSI